MQSAIDVVILENENVDEKICRRVKNRESRRRQRQLGAAENTVVGLAARCSALRHSLRPELTTGHSFLDPIRPDPLCR